MSRPIRSSSASGPIGSPQPSLIAASMSSRLAYCVSNIDGGVVEVAEQQGVGDEAGLVADDDRDLAQLRTAKASTSSSTCASVTTVPMTSTSFCTGAGLKKCMPTTRDGRPVATEISVTDSDEVLVARIVSGCVIASSRAKISRLSSSFSGTASTTSSTSLRSSMRGA